MQEKYNVGKIRGECLKALQEGSGKSVYEIADSIGVSHSAIYRWYEGTKPGAANLKAFLRSVGSSMDKLNEIIDSQKSSLQDRKSIAVEPETTVSSPKPEREASMFESIINHTLKDIEGLETRIRMLEAKAANAEARLMERIEIETEKAVKKAIDDEKIRRVGLYRED